MGPSFTFGHKGDYCPEGKEVEMVVGKVMLTTDEREGIRQYLLGGLTGQTNEMRSLVWPCLGKVVVGTDDVWRVVADTTSDTVQFDYPFVRLPPVPLSADMNDFEHTDWIKIAIAIADQTGLIADPEIMGAIERRVTEEVLEGRLIAGDAHTKVAISDGGQAIRKFAWSQDGKLAAEVAGTWRLATGEMVEVHNDAGWHIMQL